MDRIEVLVMSQFNAENYSEDNNCEQCALISITSHGDDDADIIENEYNGIESILRLQFNDSDGDDGITYDDAKAIAEFVKTECIYNRLIVHCGAGRSRSAGVAAAILKYLYNDDRQIFNNKRYGPNMRCYRYVLEALMEMDE